MRGDIDEALHQTKIVDRIRGPQPPSPMALILIERVNRIAWASKTNQEAPP